MRKTCSTRKTKAVQQNYFGEGSAGAKSLQTPLETLQGKALIHDLVKGVEEGAKCFQDGAANGRTHHRKKRISERGGILTNGFADGSFDGGSKCFTECVAASLLAAKLDGFCHDGTDIFGARLRIRDTMMQALQRFLFGSEDQVAQFFKRTGAVGRGVIRLFLRNTFCGSISHRLSAEKIPMGRGQGRREKVAYFSGNSSSSFKRRASSVKEIGEHGAISLVVAKCFGFALQGSFEIFLGFLNLVAERFGLFQNARAEVALHAGNLVFEL